MQKSENCVKKRWGVRGNKKLQLYIFHLGLQNNKYRGFNLKVDH